jgi:very-short-patch-repair endonuclease
MANSGSDNSPSKEASDPVAVVAEDIAREADDTAVSEKEWTTPAADAETDPTPRINITVEIARRITFATHQCDVAVIANLVISNPLETDLEDLTLHLSAEPKVIGDRVWTIDRITAGSEFRPRDRRISIAGGMLDALTERMRAEVVLELCQGEVVLAESRNPIVALARNEWGGAQFMPELLAAFVTPNDPAVQRLLKEASRILEAAGKSGSLEGYQARSRKRSWEVVSGIWAAVSRRGLTYAEPPASFGRQGQKIRLPSMIEEQGLATCLDTALLFAAAIEQAGLYPVVVFTEGHALAGAWLQPQTLPSLTVEDPIEIRKAMAQEELVLFETTMATGGHALPFSRAIAEAKRQVSEAHEDAFIYAIDIRQARGRDIQPLSSLAPPRTGTHAGAIDSSRAAPPLDEAPDLPPFDSDTAVDEVPLTPAERLDRWKRSLLDLSKRNRLLNLKPSATAIPIFCPDPALLEDKIAEGKRISLITPPERKDGAGEPDPALYHLRTGEDFAAKFATEALDRNEIVANVEPKVLEKGAIELYRKAKADFEEGGSNTLFLALGMLRWSAPGDTKRVYRAPLILLPVKLERRSAASKPFLKSHEDDPVFNLTLLQMLRQDFHIEIPGLAGELPTDDHGVNVRLVWEMVRARIREVPGFEVVEEVVLSTFSFAKYLMWKDLSDRTETLKASPFVRHVIDTPHDPYEAGASFLIPRTIDRTIDPSEIMAPLNADSSQIVAIHASGKGGDFVLEGPPGTGKSETIGNIIAHNLGLGHRVLFVSEKMAALDVVYRRLNACGLGDFCLELHSAKANKRAVLNQLGAAWEKRQAHSVEEWQKKAARLGQVRDHLNRLVEVLHTPGPGGLSPRDAIGRSLRYRDVHRLRLDWARDESGQGRAPTAEALSALEDLAKRLGQQFSQIQPEDLTAFKGIAHTEWSYAWVAKIVAEARELGAAIEELVSRRQAFAERLALADAGNDPDESAAIAMIAVLVPDCAALNLRFALEPDGRDAMEALENLLRLLENYRASRKLLSANYPDGRIASAPLQTWLSERVAAEAKIWPMKVFARRRLRKAIWAGLDMDASRASAPERDLATLLQLAEQQSDIDTLAKTLLPNTPWRGLDTDASIAARALQSGRRLREAVTRLSNFGRDLIETRKFLARALCDGRDLLEAGMPIAAAAADLAETHRGFVACQTRFRVASGFEGQDEETNADLDALARTAEAIVARERRLNVWCAWVAICRKAREAGLGTIVPALEIGAVAHDQVVEAFRTAYACWLAPILIDARPELNRFSAVQHEDLIQTFRELDQDLAELTAAYIRTKLSGGVPARDAGGADPGYGVLSRELQKRMRHKPVRQLVSEMGDALTALTPCLMMSPLSVAQFLPAEIQAFDLVVFDEASQITVPDAIGAIARGRRCIVVGDPRQMPPTRFFERGAEDDENEEFRDLESILDEALAARVPHHRLTGHYRSRHESLICFSNHAYYQGALVTYPSADTRETAVTFRRVDGIYAMGRTRTNVIEAKAVIAEVMRRLRDTSLNHLSIGIVTLNSEQQRLVEDLLDQERRADPELERFFGSNLQDPVFVKNLETVQGDQRDVILLSIGYGPTEPGARTMSMNFGPLNRQGGERRLNVAITRATTEVVVFASFDASMIDLTRTSAEAVKDLKHYIDFAARGPVALGEAIRSMGGSTGYDSDFEMAIAESLRQHGWTIHTQIGVSKFRIDLGVVHPDAPGRFLAGVECDGATYHSSPSARDRDRVRHIILEHLGWRLFRIWSTDFFLDPNASVLGLDAKLRALLEADRAASEEAAAAEADHAALSGTETWGETSEETGDEDVGGEDLHDGREFDAEDEEHEEDAGSTEDEPEENDGTFGRQAGWSSPRPPDPPAIGQAARAPHLPGLEDGPLSLPDPDRFYEPGYRPQLKAMAAKMIDAEGPITFKRLSDRIARAHGFQRTGRQISSTVWAACNRLRQHVATPDGHKVFWPDGVPPETLVLYRGLTIGDERREWREVPHPEKLWLVRKILVGSSADPARAVADAIGIARVTTQFRTEIAELVRHLGRG